MFCIHITISCNMNSFPNLHQIQSPKEALQSRPWMHTRLFCKFSLPPLAQFYLPSHWFSLFHLIKCSPPVRWNVRLDCLTLAFLFKCCFYVSIAPMSQFTGQRLEVSMPHATNTFPSDAQWKGDFLLVFNSETSGHKNLSCYEYSKIEPIRPWEWPDEERAITGFIYHKGSCLVIAK